MSPSGISLKNISRNGNRNMLLFLPSYVVKYIPLIITI